MEIKIEAVTNECGGKLFINGVEFKDCTGISVKFIDMGKSTCWHIEDEDVNKLIRKAMEMT